jgi:hypothetical protein
MTNQNLHNEKLAEKVQFLMSMAGTSADTALTALSYALVDTAINNEIDMMSVIRNISEMYLSRFEEDEDVSN